MPLLPYALLLLLVTTSHAAIYQFQRTFHDYVNLTEGEVFSKQDSPLGISSVVQPIVAAVGTMKVDRISKKDVVSKSIIDRGMGDDGYPPQAILHVWIFHEANQPEWDITCIEAEHINSYTPQTANSASTVDIKSNNKTKTNTKDEGILVANEPTHKWFYPENDMYTINVTHPVAMTGVHYIFLKVCDQKNYMSDNQFISIPFTWNANLIFRNPYGYTPARIYGLMPFYGLEMGLLSLATSKFFM